MLITAAESVPGVEVESVRPDAGRLDTHRELALIEEITNDPKEGLALLAEGVPRIVPGQLGDRRRPRGHPRAYRLAQSAAAPETTAADLPWLPLERTVVIDPEVQWVPGAWTALDTTWPQPRWASPRAPRRRPAGWPRVPPSELARLTHLTGIIATVLADG